MLSGIEAGPARRALCEQQGVPQDEAMLGSSLEAALDPARIPAYVKRLQDDRTGAVAGFVYANGAFRIWCGGDFAARFFTAEEANARLAQHQVLPAYILGDVLAPESRAAFFESLAEHMLTRFDEATDVCLVADVRACLLACSRFWLHVFVCVCVCVCFCVFVPCPCRSGRRALSFLAWRFLLTPISHTTQSPPSTPQTRDRSGRMEECMVLSLIHI